VAKKNITCFHEYMRINSVGNTNSITCKASRVNIVSIADNHGDVLKMQQLMKGFQVNRREIFEKATDKSTLNLFAIAGDFFMNPLKKGFFTNPGYTSGDIQYNFLTKLMYVAKLAACSGDNFDTVYTPGNHCFDGGDKWLFKKLVRSPMRTIMSNIDLKLSPTVTEAMEKTDNIVLKQIYHIPDSKNIKKLNQVLVLGVTIPTLTYYNPGVITGTTFYNDSNKNDILLEKKDLRKTIKHLKQDVQLFKKVYQGGTVILLSHCGNKLSKYLAQEIPDINLILNGHDHKDFSTLVGKTLILSHGQASQFFMGTKLNIEDDGNITIQSKKYDVEKYEPDARKDSDIQRFINVCIRKDLEPIIKFNDEIESKDLVYNDTIRYSNSFLANYYTSGIKESALKYFPDLDLVGLPSSTIRNGLKSHERRTTMNNMDFMKIFDGINENFSELSVGTISGKELYDLILENTINNINARTRNAIIQWSDIQIDRTKIKMLKNEPFSKEIMEAVKIRNSQSGKFETINFGKDYKILISKRYLIKDTANIKVPKTIKDKFTTTEHSYDSLFREYLTSVKYDVRFDDKIKENRII